MARRQAADGRAPQGIRIWLRFGLTTLAVGLLLTAAVVVAQRVERLLITNPKFALRSTGDFGQATPEVGVEGAIHVTRARVRNVFLRDTGRSVYLLPLAERRRNLLAIGWVRDATIHRSWPNRIDVRIAERTPVAFVRLPAQVRGGPSEVVLIDSDGVLLELPMRSSYTLPVLNGIRREQSEATRRQRVGQMLQLMGELGALGNDISEIDVSEPDNIKLTQQAGDRAMVLMVGKENFRSRLETFRRHYPEIRKRLPTATVLDLRLDDRITAMGGTGDER